MSGRIWACLLCLAALGAPARAAEPVRDEATGLSLRPPDGYEAQKTEGDARYAAVYAVQKKDETDTGCKIAFQPAAADPERPLTQDDINAFTRKKEWIDLIRATLALRYDVASVEPFDHRGLSGAAGRRRLQADRGRAQDGGRALLSRRDRHAEGPHHHRLRRRQEELRRPEEGVRGGRAFGLAAAMTFA